MWGSLSYRSIAVVALHETRVADTIVARGNSDAAAAFLDEHRKNEAVIHTSLSGHLLY
jgi:hypothetical protein